MDFVLVLVAVIVLITGIISICSLPAGFIGFFLISPKYGLYARFRHHHQLQDLLVGFIFFIYFYFLFRPGMDFITASCKVF